MLSSKILNIILIRAIWPNFFKAFAKEERNEISKIFHSKGKNPIPIRIKYSFVYNFFKVFIRIL